MVSDVDYSERNIGASVGQQSPSHVYSRYWRNCIADQVPVAGRRRRAVNILRQNITLTASRHVNSGLDDDLPTPVADLVVEQCMRVPEDGDYAASMVPYETMCLHEAFANEDIMNGLSDEVAEFDVSRPIRACSLAEPSISNTNCSHCGSVCRMAQLWYTLVLVWRDQGQLGARIKETGLPRSLYLDVHIYIFLDLLVCPAHEAGSGSSCRAV